MLFSFPFKAVGKKAYRGPDHRYLPDSGLRRVKPEPGLAIELHVRQCIVNEATGYWHTPRIGAGRSSIIRLAMACLPIAAGILANSILLDGQDQDRVGHFLHLCTWAGVYSLVEPTRWFMPSARISAWRSARVSTQVVIPAHVVLPPAEKPDRDTIRADTQHHLLGGRVRLGGDNHQFTGQRVRNFR